MDTKQLNEFETSDVSDYEVSAYEEEESEDELKKYVSEEENSDEEIELSDEDENIQAMNKYISNNKKSHINIRKFVKPEDRISSDRLTLYEYTDIVGNLANMISKRPLDFGVDLQGIVCPIARAKKIISERKCPFLLHRHINNVLTEVWNPNEMGFPKNIHTDNDIKIGKQELVVNQ